MNAKTWYAKAEKLFDEEYSNGSIVANLEDGFLFANHHGTFALFVPNQIAYSVKHDARKSNSLRVQHDMAIKNAKLATKQRSGKFADRKCIVREFSNDRTTTYVYEKLLRMFPKNADYYITERFGPIVVGLWDNDRFNEIGIVMPMVSNEKFIAN